jgi:malate dehydrogenase (oxaloacetate-decarboxylating)
MIELKGSSWQQRYSMKEIFTLQCRILDKPTALAKLCDIIGRTGSQINEIKLVGVDGQYLLRDITIFSPDKDSVKKIADSAKSAEGITILNIRNETLQTHNRGSIDVVSRLHIKSLTDLRMVYTPGVAEVCQTIEKDPDKAWELTGICDRVAIATNGTAVLGLGDIGTLGSLPVMEGKASIMAEFVNISAFPILIDSKDPDVFVETMVRIASGFGAIQMEDVAAPECFEIEDKLNERLNIPVFHDDQHGTATIVLAALINALKLTGRRKENSTALMLGAGAAGTAITKILLGFGLCDIVVYDSRGPIYRGRTEKMNKYKEELANITNKKNQKCSLADGFKGKDIFIGVARPNMVTKQMVASMAKKAIVLPLSNPVGEISKEEAFEAGAAIAADGRDINNAQAYPGIFRGALDAKATEITMAMKVAAAEKIAELSPQGQLVPDVLDRQIHRQIADAVANAWIKEHPAIF